MKRHGNFRDISGSRYGMLTVLHFLGKKKNRYHYYRCLCDCGKKKTILRSCLADGKTRSCGCLNVKIATQSHLTHGMTKSSEYNIWRGMKKRCHKPKNAAYRYYGARGISVCPEWRNSFDAFYAYMGPRPWGKSIDRINNDGNYEPGNCRWATAKEQSANQRRKLKSGEGESGG